uniref:EVE domain-containing protein n=1 Tax=Corynebacterium durum TaxID=61592 RepID=UPI0028EC13C2
VMRYWVGVVSEEHVLLAVDGGFCQVCHGKQAPLKRMEEGDWLLYYSPRTKMKTGEKLQAFTAAGQVIDDQVYQYQMSENFFPFRRNIMFQDITQNCPLSVARKHPEWGKYSTQLRYGHFEVSQGFFDYIYDYMQQETPEQDSLALF